MKAENFEAAVSFYGKAIELNPSNAVYFCNRYWLFFSILVHLWFCYVDLKVLNG